MRARHPDALTLSGTFFAHANKREATRNREAFDQLGHARVISDQWPEKGRTPMSHFDLSSLAARSDVARAWPMPGEVPALVQTWRLWLEPANDQAEAPPALASAGAGGDPPTSGPPGASPPDPDPGGT
jgi:hypothetical protein